MNVLVYHGSPNKFDKFKFDFVGKNNGITGGGFGLYFSESKSDAQSYGKYVYTVFLQLQNNVSSTEVTFTPQLLKCILDSIPTKHSYYEKYTVSNKSKFINTLLRLSKSDIEIIADIINKSFGGDCQPMLEILTKYGLTHTVDHETPEDPTITHYIIYDINAINMLSIEKI